MNRSKKHPMILKEISMKNRTRRDILKGLAGTAVFSAVAPAYAKGRRRLKQVTSFPKNFPGAGTAPENIAKRIHMLSEGALEIKIYAAGELVGAFEVFDAVVTGAADMYSSTDYYWQGKHPAFSFFTTWPFGMTSTEFSAWINVGDGQKLWDELTAQFNTKSFLSADTGSQAGGWFNKEITILDDIKGLKMRIPGLGGEVLRRMGGIPVILPGGEVYPSLQSGAIDAAEWIGPWNDLAFGFHQVTKYFYAPGFQEPNGGLSTGINLDVWHSLSKTHQTIIETACQAEVTRTTAQYFYNNAQAFQTLKNKHNVQVRQFPPEIIAQAKIETHKIFEKLSTNNELFRRIYQSIKKHMLIFNDWSQYAEEGYMKFRRDSESYIP